ncbi:hypothetical protein [Ornithinimicrobium cryptoxanthini]|uniref:Uncharacterized protein n=1 Tax=Ornithinimicrobium cryptoxanthini TaxID=2934161 RepID=A0ABY4YMZ1_9MICO|nr:hypothetical protein [Ornithinimicrobium cryptoxanthini]USQ77517.1 hypothetical protein NF557_06310 [Ornithinimicrobium cryptoxanthini]
MAHIDYTALRMKPSPRKVAAWRESVRAHDEQAGLHGPASHGPRPHASSWVIVVASLAIAGAVISLITGLMILLTERDTFGLLAAAVVAAFVFGGLWVYFQWKVRQLAEGWSGAYRLMAFAADNGFHAVPVAGPAELPGRIFGRGLDGNRVRHDVVAWNQSGRRCQVATESWHSGNPADGDEPDDAGSCRYLAVHIGSYDLPQMTFFAWGIPDEDQSDDEQTDGPRLGDEQTDAHRAGDDPGNPGTQSGEPPSEQEHDLDPRLVLVPDSQALAQTIFTDRVVSLLSDPAQPRDAEVVEEWFLAYDLTDTDPLDVAGWERTFALVAALPAALGEPETKAG